MFIDNGGGYLEVDVGDVMYMFGLSDDSSRSGGNGGRAPEKASEHQQSVPIQDVTTGGGNEVERTTWESFPNNVP